MSTDRVSLEFLKWLKVQHFFNVLKRKFSRVYLSRLNQCKGIHFPVFNTTHPEVFMSVGCNLFVSN